MNEEQRSSADKRGQQIRYSSRKHSLSLWVSSVCEWGEETWNITFQGMCRRVETPTGTFPERRAQPRGVHTQTQGENAQHPVLQKVSITQLSSSGLNTKKSGPYCSAYSGKLQRTNTAVNTQDLYKHNNRFCVKKMYMNSNKRCVQMNISERAFKVLILIKFIVRELFINGMLNNSTRATNI